MKVLHVIPSVAAVHGGPSEAIRIIEQAVRDVGISIETCTTTDDGPDRHVERPVGKRIVEEGVHRRYFRKDTEFYKCSWDFARWARRHVAEYDVVHIHALFSFVSNCAAWAAQRARVPYIVRPLGVLNSYGLRTRRPLLKRLSLRLIEGRVLRNAAAVHHTSDAERTEVEQLGYPIRSVVIPLALRQNDLPAPAAADPMPHLSGRQIVLFMSRLDPKKNLEALLHAFRTISSKHPNAQLVVAGTGERGYVQGLRALGDSLALNERIQWAGHVQNEQKSSLLEAASVFVLPSFSENFGLAAAEALAAGKPCVLGNGVALADQVASAEAGVSINTGAEDIAAALDRLLSNPELMSRMSANARAFAAAEFSSKVMGLRLRQLYESVVKEAAH